MAQAEHTAIYNVDASQLLSAVMDYEKYPEFVDGMKKVTVERNGNSVVAHYELSMMGKDMSYSLTLQEEPEQGHLSWTLLKSEFFKVNNGDWLIESLGPGKCKARYFSEVEFTFPVPGFMLKPMVKGAIPKMMEGFHLRAKTLPTPKLEPEIEIPDLKPSATNANVEAVSELVATSPKTTSNESKEEAREFHHSGFQAKEIKNEETSETMQNLGDSGVLSWAKKVMTVGVGTFFLTEESLRSMISEFKLPKEIVATILDGAKGVRKEFMQNVVNEMMSKVSDKMNPAEILAEFLKKNEVTLEVKIKVKDKSESDV